MPARVDTLRGSVGPCDLVYKSFIVAGLLSLASVPASATFSVVAVDTLSGEVGGAGASCLGATVSVHRIFGSVPGRGVVHIQAELGQPARMALAIQGLQGDVAPVRIIEDLTAPDFDARFASRQYGIVDVRGRSAAFTGDANLAFAGDRRGRSGRFTFSVQGNVLTGQGVIDSMESAFDAPGCDLPEALILALEAGGGNGGDMRCAANGISADGAFLQVDRLGEPAGSYLQVRVDNASPEDALVALRAVYDEWRLEHPCAEEEEDVRGATGSSDAGVMMNAGRGCTLGGDDPPQAWLLLCVWGIVWRRLHVASCARKR